MSETTAPPLPVPAGTAAPPPDFPDWLSPIVVKELRQGLNSRAFLSVFVLLQVGLALVFFLAAAAQVEGRSGMREMDGFFWTMMWIPLIFVMPFRAITMVSEERKAQTLELIQMTRMRSLRIAFGKWLALNIQSLLMLVATLPYLVLRYFFGGVDVVGDIGTVLSLFSVSMVLTAAGVAASTLGAGLRIVVTICFGLMFLSGAQILVMITVFPGGSITGGPASGGPIWVVGVTVILVAFYVAFFLTQAAGHLATQTENLCGLKRGLGFLALLVGLLGLVLGPTEEAALTLMALLPIPLWTVIEALCSKPDPDWELAEGRSMPLVKRWLHAPGWAAGSGLLFVAALLVGGALVSLGQQEGLSREDEIELWVLFLVGVGAVLTPALLLLGWKGLKQRVLGYWALQLGFVLLFTLAMMVSVRPGISQTEALVWVSFAPPTAFLGMLDEDNVMALAFLALPASGLVMLLWGVALIRHRAKMKRLHREEDE